MNGISAYSVFYKNKRSCRLYFIRRRLAMKRRQVLLLKRIAHAMVRKRTILNFMRKSKTGILRNKKILQTLKTITPTTVITSIARTQFKTCLPAALVTNLVSSIVALITSMLTLGLLKKEEITHKGILASSIINIIASLTAAVSSVTALMIDGSHRKFWKKQKVVDSNFITSLENELQDMSEDELIDTYQEFTKSFNKKMNLKKNALNQTETFVTPEVEKKVEVPPKVTPKVEIPTIRLTPPEYKLPSAQTTVSESQVPEKLQPVASVPVSTTVPCETTANVTQTTSTITTTTQVNDKPIMTHEVKDLPKELILQKPTVHPDLFVETRTTQYKKSSNYVILDGSDPAKVVYENDGTCTDMPVYAMNKKINKLVDVSGAENMCLSNCLQHFSNSKTANDLYTLPDYEPSIDGKLEKVSTPFKKGEMQSIAMIQSFCAHHKANAIVYDAKGSVLAVVKTHDGKSFIQLQLNNEHFKYFTSGLKYDYNPIPCNFKTYTTGDIRGGADVPAIIRGVSAVALGTGVGTALLAGSRVTKVSQAISLWNSGVAFTGSARDFGVYICKNMLGMQLDNEDTIVEIYKNLIEYGTTLLTMRASDLNHDPNLATRMKNFGPLVASAIASKVNTDAAKGLSMNLRTLVMQVNTHMETLINAQATLQTRPVPKCYLIRGAQGVGKSSLIPHLCKDISNVLALRDINLEPTVYDLRQDNNGFFGVYSGQPYGLVDEFQLKGDKDPFFDIINRVVSSTSFAMPSAFVKDQFCKINCIFLCANSELVNLKGRFPEASVPAIQSRIQDIEVRFCPGGVETPIHAGNRDTIPREEDHSDLAFSYHTYDYNGKPITKSMTYRDIVNLCAEGIFLSLQKCNTPPPNESLALLDRLEKMIEDKMSAQRSIQEEKIEDVGIKMPQSGGTEHVICHIYGDVGTGKTTMAEETIIPKIRAILPMLPVYIIKSKETMKQFTKHPAQTPVIALLDDMIINHQVETQDFISSCMNPSIIIITSNQIVKEKQLVPVQRFVNFTKRKAVKHCYSKEEFQLVKNYHKTWYTQYLTEGLARRSGMYGTLIVKGQEVLVSRDFSSCYKMSPKTGVDRSEPMILGTKIKVDPSVITRTIFDQYCKISTRTDGMEIKPINGVKISEELDVDIAVDSVEKLKICCKSPIKFYCLDGTEKCILNNKVITRYNGFIPSSTEPLGDEDPCLSLIRTFIVNLWRAGTDLRCRLKVGDSVYYAEHGILYVPRDLLADITVNGDMIQINDSSFKIEDVHIYLNNRKMFRDYDDNDKKNHFLIATYRSEIEALPEYQAYAIKTEEKLLSQVASTVTLNKAKNLYHKIPKAVKVITAILLAVAASTLFASVIWGSIKLFKNRKSKDTEEHDEPEDDNKEDDTRKNEHPYFIDLGEKAEQKKGKNKARGSGKGITSDHNPLTGTNTVSYKLSNFQYQSDSMRENVRYAQGTHMTFLDSHTAVTVHHCSIKTGDIIFKQPVTVFGELPAHDIKYLHFEKAVQGIKDIRHKMATMQDVCNTVTGNYKGQQVTIRFKKVVTNTIDGTEDTREVFLDQILAMTPEGEQFTFSGDCGTPLLIRDTKGARVIAGILTGCAGNVSTFSWIPTKKYVQQSQDKNHILITENQRRLVMEEEHQILKSLEPRNNMDLNIEGGIEPIGRFRFFPPPVKDTKKPTPFAENVGDLVKCPAKLTYREEEGPYHSSQMLVKGKPTYAQLPTLINKHAVVEKKLDTEILAIAVKMSVIHKIGIHGIAYKRMTPYQVLNGFRGKDNSLWSGSLGCIRLETGAGIWQSLAGVPLKSGLFVKDIHGSISWQENLVAARTRVRCESVLKTYRAGEVPLIIYLDSLKSELLGIDKVAEGKIRLYQAAPIEQVYAGRALFGIFMALSNLYHLKLHSQVGINPYTDIDPIIQRFLKVSTSGEDGDYKNYDKSIPMELILAVAEVVNGVLDDDPENAVARRAYLKGVAASVHAANGVLYTTPQGNPSGDPLTTMLNNEVNVLIEYYCFVKAFSHLDKTPKEWEEFFHKNVDFVCAGDDKITVIHPDIQDQYNFQVKQKIITEDFGMQYTPASKQTTGKPIIDLMDMSFCSRKIRYDKNYEIFVGALKKESLLSLLQWVIHPTYDQMAQNVNTYIAEAVFHDDDTAKELFLTLDKVFKKLPELRVRTRYPLSLDLTRKLIYCSLNTIRYSAEDLDENFLRANNFPCDDEDNEYIHSIDHNCHTFSYTDITGKSFLLYLLVPKKAIPFDMCTNWTAKLYELCQKNGWRNPEFTQHMMNESPVMWRVKGECHEKHATAFESNVKAAKEEVCHNLYNQLYWIVPKNKMAGPVAKLVGKTVIVTFKDDHCIEEATGLTYPDMTTLLNDLADKLTPLDLNNKEKQSMMPGNTPPAKLQGNKDAQEQPQMQITGKVPQLGIIAAGITGDLKTKAYSNWVEVKTGNIDSSKNRFDIIETIKYEKDVLGGFQKRYLDYHSTVSGDIAVKLNIMGQPGQKGSFILCAVRSSEITADTTSLTPDQITSICNTEFSARDNTSFDFLLSFNNQTQAYIDNTKDWPEPEYTWVLVAGFKVEGLLATSDAVSTISYAFKTRFADNFIVENAYIPRDVKSDVKESDGPSQFIGRTLENLFGQRVYIATDGFRANQTKVDKATQNICGTVFPIDPTIPMNPIRFDFSLFWDQKNLEPPLAPDPGFELHKFAGSKNDSNNIFHNIWPSAYNPSTDKYVLLLGEQPDGYIHSDMIESYEPTDSAGTKIVPHFYLNAEKLYKELGSPDTTGTIGELRLSVNRHYGGGLNDDRFKFLNCTFKTWGLTTLIEYSDDDQELLNMVYLDRINSYGTTKLPYADAAYMPGALITNKASTGYYIWKIETLNVIDDSSPGKYYYPTTGMTRVAFSYAAPPQVSERLAQVGNPTVVQSQKILKVLNDIKETIPQGKELELRLNENYMGQFAIIVRIPSDPEINAYTYANLPYAVADHQPKDFTITGAQFIQKGIPISRHAAPIFRNRIVSSTKIDQTTQTIDIGRKEKQAAAAIIGGSVIAGLGNAVGGLGGAALSNKHWKQHNAIMFDQYKEIFDKRNDWTDHLFDRALTNASELVHKQMQANVSFQQQIRNMDSPAYRGAIPEGSSTRPIDFVQGDTLEPTPSTSADVHQQSESIVPSTPIQQSTEQNLPKTFSDASTHITRDAGTMANFPDANETTEVEVEPTNMRSSGTDPIYPRVDAAAGRHPDPVPEEPGWMERMMNYITGHQPERPLTYDEEGYELTPTPGRKSIHPKRNTRNQTSSTEPDYPQPQAGFVDREMNTTYSTGTQDELDKYHSFQQPPRRGLFSRLGLGAVPPPSQYTRPIANTTTASKI